MIRRLALIVLPILCLAAPVRAQSMNVRAIVTDVMSRICGPYADSGDIIQAIADAKALGYRPVGYWADRTLAPNDPPGEITLSRRHHGVVTLTKAYSRAICAVGVAEGGPSNMGEAAAPIVRAMGMEPVVDVRDQDPLDIVVWRGAGRQLVIASSPHFTPGSELVFSFDTGWRAPDN